MLVLSMKKFIGIIVLSLLLCNVGISETNDKQKKRLDEVRKNKVLLIESLTRNDVNDEWLKKRSYNDLMDLDFKRSEITTTKDYVQYHLYRNFTYDPYKDDYASTETFSKGYVPPLNETINVVCFLTSENTICRLP